MNEPLMHATIALAARCAENDSPLTAQEAGLIAQELANIHGLDGHDQDMLLDAAESFTAPLTEVLEDLGYDPTAAAPVDDSEWAPSSLPFQRSIAKSLKPALVLVPSHDTQREIPPQRASEPQSGPAPMMVPVALPAALPPTAPVVQISPQSTNWRSSARMALVQPRASTRPIPSVLGGIIASAAAAIAIVLSTGGPAEHKVSYANIAGYTTADAGSLGDATVLQSSPPGAAPSAVAPKPAPPPTEAIETECRGYLAARKWSDLAECADKLRPLDAKAAEELKTRADGEARSAPHIASVDTALHDGDLKRAKAELDQVWPQSVAYLDIKHMYELAEAQEIYALATLLDSVKDARCEAYNRLLAKARATNPPSVLARVARRVPCKPPPKCDVDALTATAAAQFNANRVDNALALLEEAYRCRPGSAVLQKALVIACSVSDVAKAKSYWKRISPGFRAPALDTCMRHGITEAALGRPVNTKINQLP